MTLLLISSELECNVLKCTEQCPHENNVYCDTNLIGYQSETERRNWASNQPYHFRSLKKDL